MTGSAARAEVVSIGFVVPLSGPVGLLGPSSLACGELAVGELNAGSGILGRRVELVPIDAGRAPEVVAADVAQLVRTGQVDALAGWHISAVRQAITARVGGEVTYAYSAMHEGEDHTPGVFMLGERPANQVLPALRWMDNHLGARRWIVVGNDYVYPRVTAHVARQGLARDGGSVEGEFFVPLGTTDFAGIIGQVRHRQPDGVVMLLMGQDAVQFNRQFAAAGLPDSMVRLSPAVEENALLASGVRATGNLYAAAAYFDALTTDASQGLAHRYAARFGDLAPMLNAVGESCYEAVHFVAALAARAGSLRVADVERVAPGLVFVSPRGELPLVGNRLDQDVYLARAEGLTFAVTDRIACV